MKISIDGILGSARKISSRRQLEDESVKQKSGGIKSDTLSLSSRLNSRIENIETELKGIQSSLTVNQMIRHGLRLIEENPDKNRDDMMEILKQNGLDRLNIINGTYSPGKPDMDSIRQRAAGVESEISTGIDKLRHLQVEVENIMASDLARKEALMPLMDDINSIFRESEPDSLNRIASLRADVVMKLLK